MNSERDMKDDVPKSQIAQFIAAIAFTLLTVHLSGIHRQVHHGYIYSLAEVKCQMIQMTVMLTKKGLADDKELMDSFNKLSDKTITTLEKRYSYLEHSVAIRITAFFGIIFSCWAFTSSIFEFKCISSILVFIYVGIGVVNILPSLILLPAIITIIYAVNSWLRSIKSNKPIHTNTAPASTTDPENTE